MRLASSVSLLAVLFAGACCGNAEAQLLPADPSCPQVSLRLNLDGGRMLRTSANPAKHSVTVTLSDGADDVVREADITLLGLNAPAGVYPTSPVPKPIRAPFHLVRPEGAVGPLVVELTLPAAMVSVSGGTVDAVSYRNGETWKPVGQATCRVWVGSPLLASR